MPVRKMTLPPRLSVFGLQVEFYFLCATLVACDSGSTRLALPNFSARRLHDVSHKISTDNSGRAYREECKDARVPVPRSLLDEAAGWTNRGEILTEFVSTPLEAELWTWEVDEGICMALPRWRGNDTAELFGLICFGYETGNTCFWDNKTGDFLARYQVHSIEDLIGGVALEDNQQGVCSNCHAGENPFVVDPYEPAFDGLWGISGETWPTPIVPEKWIGNPGPISSLGPVPGYQGKCTECHNAEERMRFPLILKEHMGAFSYCEDILGNTIEKSPDAPDLTMPPYFATNQFMGIHTERIWGYCEKGPASDYIEETDFTPPKPSVLSPLNLGPYYECAEGVGIGGAVHGAMVELWTDSQGPFTAIATNGAVAFDLDQPLQFAEKVFATQALNGIVSPSSYEIANASPDQLPPPKFRYTPLYECASSVLVGVLPGANGIVEHRRQGVTLHVQHKRGYHGTLKATMPVEDFQQGDVLFATQSLCEQTSESEEPVERFSGVMTTPVLDPVWEGQRTIAVHGLVQGGSLEVLHDTQGTMRDEPSVPSRSSHVDLQIDTGNQPLNPGDTLTLNHRLCPDDFTQVQTEVLACDPAGLAPDVLPAFEGNDFVVIANGIPGATIDVYAEGLSHIASGTGPDVKLVRSLAEGEKIWVTQSLPGCSPTTASRLTVL